MFHSDTNSAPVFDWIFENELAEVVLITYPPDVDGERQINVDVPLPSGISISDFLKQFVI